LKILVDRVIDPDSLVLVYFPAEFGVDVFKGWTKQWEDVEGPVEPAGQLLPASYCMSAFWFDPVA
jgi:hypothetical protein